MRRYYGSWVVFFLLGGLMGFLRYGKILGPSELSLLSTYGPWIMLLIYVAIILAAFRDTVYQGILCVLVPLYPLYYLFMASDIFYARAVVAGLLIGLGQDTAVFCQDNLTHVIDNARTWIGSGG